MTYHPSLVEQATAIAVRDQLHPFQGTRHDTGEPIWLVQSRSDPTHHYLLTVKEDTIQCPCLQYRHREVCAHVAAVRLALQTQQPQNEAGTNPQRVQTMSHPTPQPSLHPEPRTEQERQQREAADCRDRALLWTDDRPFSIWKS